MQAYTLYFLLVPYYIVCTLCSYRAGWYILPEGGDGAYQEGHYAYFLPELAGCDERLPYFRNAEQVYT